MQPKLFLIYKNIILGTTQAPRMTLPALTDGLKLLHEVSSFISTSAAYLALMEEILDGCLREELIQQKMGNYC